MAKDITSPFLQNTTEPAESTGVSLGALDVKPADSKVLGHKKRLWQDFGTANEFEIKLPVHRDEKKDPSRKPSFLRFSPLRLLERVDLPIAFLDTSRNEHANTADLGSQFFVSRAQVLENCFGNGYAVHSLLLVARQREDARLYAIEQVRDGIYAICRLGSWVKDDDLRSRAEIRRVDAGFHSKLNDGNGQISEWWRSAVLKDETASLERPSKRIKVSMGPPPAVSGKGPEDCPTVQGSLVTTTANHAATISSALDQPAQITEFPENTSCDLVQPQVTKEGLFENLVTQYLETLYLSRASLAFFAKGPLSRIRAAFSTVGNDMKPSDLPTFLRSMLLTLPSMDKKFKEKLLALVRELSPLSSDEEDANNSPDKKKKKRSKKRKLRLSKEGVYPFEDEYIKKWWKGNEESSADRVRSHETAEQALRRRIGDLQIRETLSQIILLLEILALEASDLSDSSPTVDEKNSELKETGPQTADEKVKRKRKPQDLKTTLDLLVDKLTIWQSVEHEEEYLPLTQGNGQKDNKDRLGSFCTEVIIPFYKSRVPDQATQIIKKFGGPGLLSPEKARKPTASKPKDQPASKNAAKNPRRPLQKTGSEVLLKRRPPGLSRSATDSVAVIPGIKREVSETTSLSAIPQFGEKPKPSRRDSLASLKHLKARQVNLNEISASANLKRKRKEQLEEDLKTAIANIKKPNRGGVGREVAAEREKRGTNIGSSKKGSKGLSATKGERKVLHTMPNVQVLATPHHGRRTDIFAQPLPLPQLQASPEEIDLVPSSGVRSVRSDGNVIPGTEIKSTSSARRQSVTETPSRIPAKTVMFESISKPMSQPTAFDSASNNRMISDPGRGVVAQTPSRVSNKTPLFTTGPRRPVSRQSQSQPSFTIMDSSPFKPKSPAAIPGTPLKAPSVGVIPSTPAAVAASKRTVAEKSEGGSIYDMLGWDDDDIDELA